MPTNLALDDSLILRRRSDQLSSLERGLVEHWAALVISGRAVLAGPIRQEILSGIRSPEICETLREKLLPFRYLEILPKDYDQAALFFNLCRSKGVTGSRVDMLLCALAYRYGVPIFSTEGDFPLYVSHLPIRLYKPPI